LLPLKTLAPKHGNITHSTYENPFSAFNFLLGKLIGTKHGHRQGDQIGQFFANWAIVYLGQFSNTTEVAQFVGLLYSPVKGMIDFWQQNGLGYILGDFSTSSSGHPGHRTTNVAS
jgi:hypothetical protein